mgnify:CR=1 FL=1
MQLINSKLVFSEYYISRLKCKIDLNATLNIHGFDQMDELAMNYNDKLIRQRNMIELSQLTMLHCIQCIFLAQTDQISKVSTEQIVRRIVACVKFKTIHTYRQYSSNLKL